MARRYDRITLDSPVSLASGGIRADATLTRAGVFSYRNADGTQRLEYRPPAEVFAPESLSSLRLAPLILGHDPANPDASHVTPETYSGLAVGSVGEPVQVQDHVDSAVAIMRADAVAAVQAGTHRDLSCGYDAEVDETPGTTPEGVRYDACQKTIRYNHVALVPKGRAGNASLHLDAAEQVTPDEPTPREDAMDPKKLTALLQQLVDAGVNPDAVQMMLKALASMTEKPKAEPKPEEPPAAEPPMDAAPAAPPVAPKADAAAEARADAAEAEAKRMRDSLPGLVRARVELERQAAPVLGPDTKLDALSDDEVRAAVIAKLDGKKLEGQSPEYLRAYYDATIARPRDTTSALRRDAFAAGAAGGAPDLTKLQAEAAERAAGAWKTKPNK